MKGNIYIRNKNRRILYIYNVYEQISIMNRRVIYIIDKYIYKVYERKGNIRIEI